MAKKQIKPKVTILPLQERLRIARLINEYRAAHPRMRVAEILKEPEVVKMTGPVTESNYWAWRKRLDLAQAKGEVELAHRDEAKVEQHFPLEIIPSKPPTKRRQEHNAERLSQLRAARIPISRNDEDRDLAASLLEIATRLLKR